MKSKYRHYRVWKNGKFLAFLPVCIIGYLDRTLGVGSKRKRNTSPYGGKFQTKYEMRGRNNRPKRLFQREKITKQLLNAHKSTNEQNRIVDEVKNQNEIMS